MSSVTLVHPSKAVGRNEMPFGGDTRVVQSSIVLGRSPGPPYRKGRFWESEPPVRSDMPHIAKLLCTLLFFVSALCGALRFSKSIECRNLSSPWTKANLLYINSAIGEIVTC